MRNLNIVFYDINEFIKNMDPISFDRIYRSLNDMEINKKEQEAIVFDKEIDSNLINENDLFKYLIFEILTKKWLDNMNDIDYNKYLEGRIFFNSLEKFDLNSLILFNFADKNALDTDYSYSKKDSKIEDFNNIIMLINNFLNSSNINSDADFLSLMIKYAYEKIKKRIK